MTFKERNFLEYLAAEEQNLLTSIINFRTEFDLFYNLDHLFQKPLKGLEVPASKALIPHLYGFVHFYLYFSVSCILRSHFSECLSSIRKAIDATLSAYKIILEPATGEKYLERDKYFQFIKRNIKNEIKQDSNQYPLAHTLIQMHEACSQYGSHADIDTFIYRTKMTEIPGTNKDLFQFYYFQIPTDIEEYRFHYMTALQAFLLMLRVFKIFFDKHYQTSDQEWESAIMKFHEILENRREPFLSKLRENSP